MRKAGLELFLLVVVITGMHTFKIMKIGSIKGRVYPSNTLESVVAVNGTDSVRAMSENGSFAMILRPGVWKVIFAVRQQARNIIRDNIEVAEGKNTNLGEIRLSE
jgi:hypothetical protein